MRIATWLVAAAGAVLVHGVISAPLTAAPPGVPPVNADLGEPAMSVPAPRPDARPPLDPVRVRLYRSTRIHDGALSSALRVADGTFAAAGIQVLWTVCQRGECGTPLAPAERVVRLVRLVGDQRRDLRCLGDALIDPQHGSGALATVYVDQVMDLARRGNVDRGALLGHTIAHEIGHLLLGSTAHGASGLMRETWSQKELRMRRPDDWALLPFEAAAIRLRLTMPQRPA